MGRWLCSCDWIMDHETVKDTKTRDSFLINYARLTVNKYQEHVFKGTSERNVTVFSMSKRWFQ